MGMKAVRVNCGAQKFPAFRQMLRKTPRFRRFIEANLRQMGV
jgi:hypothetical protein